LNIFNGTLEFDSYMRQESDLQVGEHRLYETDFPLVLPKFTHIRFMITADDVIHSWSVPALGIKVDAVPGRINHAHTYIKYSGIFYGQCSELCGVNHAFMPIQILVFEPQMYYDYIRLMLLAK
jgi:heme/copper-type cytochrome/quinol oxidase subunit 2